MLSFDPTKYGAVRSVSKPTAQQKFTNHPAMQDSPSMLSKVGGFLGDVSGVSGVAKGVGEATKVAKGLVTGKEYNPQVTPTQFAGSAGKLGLNVALATGTGGASIPAMAGIGGGLSVAESLEKGETPTLGGVATGAAVGAAIPLAGKAIGAAKRSLTEVLPHSLIKNYIPTGTKDISKYVLENKPLGTTKQMLADSKNVVKELSGQVDDILEQQLVPATYNINATKPNEIINTGKFLKGVAQSYGQSGGGGTLNSKEVLKSITKVAPEVKGLLNRENLTLVQANNVRKAIDQALGDRFFLAKHSPFTKQVAGAFNDSLRNTIKEVAPDTKPLFDEMSKNIAISKALSKVVDKSGKIGLKDILSIMTGVSTGAVGGPIGAIAGGATALGLERAASSPAVGVGVAKGLSRLGQKSAPEALKRATKMGILDLAD